MTDKLLTIVVCGAGPASEIGVLIDLAQGRGWQTQLIATPSALAFLDVDALEARTGWRVRSEYRKPGEPRSSEQSAGFIVAPATFNTINKLAAGISDTYALGVLSEAIGVGLPVIVLPFINSALANRLPLQESIKRLESEGVAIIGAEHGNEPHEPHTGSARLDLFPWSTALGLMEEGSVGE